jgi:hypothetical protein
MRRCVLGYPSPHSSSLNAGALSPQVVVVDNHYACIGGLDLCFGRWDMHTHPLADVHPTNFSKTMFPGQDYNNARIKDFENVWQFASGTIDMLDTARMPWHDVSALDWIVFYWIN